MNGGLFFFGDWRSVSPTVREIQLSLPILFCASAKCKIRFVFVFEIIYCTHDGHGTRTVRTTRRKEGVIELDIDPASALSLSLNVCDGVTIKVRVRVN